jgi:hypothetical protein
LESASYGIDAQSKQAMRSGGVTCVAPIANFEVGS